MSQKGVMIMWRAKWMYDLVTDCNLDQNWSWNWKISFQLSGICHFCHHQDFEIDWTLAQHSSKSWKISLQLSRIAHICHHQDLDIDWNLAQHSSKSWKISPTVGNLTSVTTIMRSKSQNGVEKCYSKATWERPIWDAPKAIFAAKMQSANSLRNHQYSTEHCMNSCCKIAAQRI
jgi:hypothetical protein